MGFHDMMMSITSSVMLLIVHFAPLGYNPFMPKNTSNNHWRLDELEAQVNTLQGQVSYLTERVRHLELIAGVEPPDEDDEFHEDESYG